MSRQHRPKKRGYAKAALKTEINYIKRRPRLQLRPIDIDMFVLFILGLMALGVWGLVHLLQ